MLQNVLLWNPHLEGHHMQIYFSQVFCNFSPFFEKNMNKKKSQFPTWCAAHRAASPRAPLACLAPARWCARAPWLEGPVWGGNSITFQIYLTNIISQPGSCYWDWDCIFIYLYIYIEFLCFFRKKYKYIWNEMRRIFEMFTEN